MSPAESDFAGQLTRLVHDFRGKLPEGGRGFWLFAAALATLDEELTSRHPNEKGVGIVGFTRAAELAFNKARQYVTRF